YYTFYFILSNSSKNFSFLTLINVPFIPNERDSITPALSNLRNALTITERVIPTLSATLDAISKPSLPPSSSKICSMASLSEYDNELIAILIAALSLASCSTSLCFSRSISIPITVAAYSPKTRSFSEKSSCTRPSTNVPSLSPPPSIGKIVDLLSLNTSSFSGGKTERTLSIPILDFVSFTSINLSVYSTGICLFSNI